MSNFRFLLDNPEVSSRQFYIQVWSSRETCVLEIQIADSIQIIFEVLRLYETTKGKSVDRGEKKSKYCTLGHFKSSTHI